MGRPPHPDVLQGKTEGGGRKTRMLAKKQGKKGQQGGEKKGGRVQKTKITRPPRDRK